MIDKEKSKQGGAIHLVESEISQSPLSKRTQMLSELFSRLERRHQLERGDFVCWKSGLKNRTAPEYGEPAIVVAALSLPIFDPSEQSAASPYFQEPLTLVIGVFREEDFLEFRVDGRRFEPFGEVAAK